MATVLWIVAVIVVVALLVAVVRGEFARQRLLTIGPLFGPGANGIRT